jgi:hypothetical protein
MADELGELETRCDSCDGMGGYEELGRWCRCCWCDGAGSVPTELGRRILKLVGGNLRWILERLKAE